MTALSVAALPAQGRALFPGVLACGVVAAAATFLSEHYGAPVMLFALLLGMAMNFLSADGTCVSGIEFTARQVLRVGVALLGLRITVAQIAAWVGNDVSRWCLVAAIAAIGMKTQLKGNSPPSASSRLC